MTKRKTKHIPNFKNREEMAAFFDTHDMADFQDEFKTVKVRFARKLSEGITIRFDEKTLHELRKKASEQGIGPTTLVRMWVLAQLKKTEASSATKK